jgi:citrate lyase subunit gamma (acyl carrier protein)
VEIKKTAVAGTLESSDVQITVAPSAGVIDIELDSNVINQFGNQIKKVVLETLEKLGVTSVSVSVVDRGALDSTIAARLECAVFRAAGHEGKVPWGAL